MCMSYEVLLLERDYLRRSLASGARQWGLAPPLSKEIHDAIFHSAKAEGFVEVPRTAPIGTRLQLDTSLLSVELQLFVSLAIFSVQPSTTASASIAFTRDFSRRLASELGLGFFNPDTGDSWLGEA